MAGSTRMLSHTWLCPNTPQELSFGWQHRPVPSMLSAWTWSADARGGGTGPAYRSRWGACGLACVAMCVAFMCTGMSGLDEWALPTTPGAVYKSPDVAMKHRVWQTWGFENAAMRT